MGPTNKADELPLAGIIVHTKAESASDDHNTAPPKNEEEKSANPDPGAQFRTRGPAYIDMSKTVVINIQVINDAIPKKDDPTLVPINHPFCVYRDVICHFSDYFRDVFMKPDGVGFVTQTVTLTKIDPAIFSRVIAWIHTGTVDDINGRPPFLDVLINIFLVAQKTFIFELMNNIIPKILVALEDLQGTQSGAYRMLWDSADPRLMDIAVNFLVRKQGMKDHGEAIFKVMPVGFVRRAAVIQKQLCDASRRELDLFLRTGKLNSVSAKKVIGHEWVENLFVRHPVYNTFYKTAPTHTAAKKGQK